MAKTILIKTLNVRKRQIGVVYLIHDDSTNLTKKRDMLLPNGVTDAQTYGESNKAALFADELAETVPNKEFYALDDQDKRSVYEDAILALIGSLRGDDDLSEINAAMRAVYDADGTRTTLIETLYTRYRAGTSAQKDQFLLTMLYTILGLTR